MAIEKTGAKLLRRFRLPERNIDLALVRTKEGVLELYKNSRIPGTKLDCFTKVAQKEVWKDFSYGRWQLDYSPKKVRRIQFDSKGEIIGRSEVIQDRRNKNIKIGANDQSVKMSNGVLKIDNKGVNVVEYKSDELKTDKFKIQFMGDKLTPMAKRILKLFNKVINK